MTAPTPPPVSRVMTGAIARLGRYAVFMHEETPHLYELPPGQVASNPYATCQHLCPLASIPKPYLRLRDVQTLVREAVADIQSRLALVAR